MRTETGPKSVYPSFLINGRVGAAVDVLDRGLQYGDGLFETIAVRGGKALLWSLHVNRLLDGCRRLGIGAPDMEELAREVGSLARDLDRAVIKIIVTRGSGGRGYRPAQDSAPTRVVCLFPWPSHLDSDISTGVRVRLCSTRLGWNARLAGIKHLNRLEQVLARSEWQDPDVAEGLMQDQAGFIVEGTQTNLFLTFDKRDRIVTPSLERCGVRGVMREHIANCCREVGVVLEERDIEMRDLEAAEGMFLSNSLIGIWPVREFEGRAYAIGQITTRLLSVVDRAGEV